MHKKLICLLLSLFITLSLGFNVNAIESMKISSESDCFVATPGDSISIPLYIKNNSGIMGFKIGVNYPSNVLSTPSAKKTGILKNGNFVDSICESTSGFFEVLWSGTSDISSDGELFVLNFIVSEFAVSGEYNISFTYSQDDTFNEKWEDVSLVFNDVVIVISGETEQVPDESEPISIFQRFIEKFRKILEKIISIISGVSQVK